MAAFFTYLEYISYIGFIISGICLFGFTLCSFVYKREDVSSEDLCYRYPIEFYSKYGIFRPLFKPRLYTKLQLELYMKKEWINYTLRWFDATFIALGVGWIILTVSRLALRIL